MAYLDEVNEILCAVCETQPATGVVCVGDDDSPDYREIWHCDDCWKNRHAALTYMLTRDERFKLAMQIEEDGRDSD